MARNKGYFIRNSIIVIDFIMVNLVMTLYYNHDIGHLHPLTFGVSLPLLLLMANGSMAFAQLFFSNVVHGHYMAIDKVLRQVCLLSCLYGFIFMGALESCKFFFNTPCPDAHFTLISIGLTIVAIIVTRVLEYLLLRQLRKYGRNSRSLIFVGTAKALVDAFNDINLSSHAGLKVLGYYSDETIDNQPQVVMERLGSLTDLRHIIETDGQNRLSDDIYCTDIPNDNKLITMLVDYSVRNGIQFNYVPLFINDFGYCLKPRVEGELVVFSNLNEPLLSLGNRIMKRTFDVIVSGACLIVLSPFIPIIGAIIKISSPGPIFFKQKRTGLNGEEFNMLKFRSMHVNKDADRLQATRDDPRKFAFGNFMRKTNIDELPQVLNVFVGDMSIVGPRPHMLAHTDEYRKKIYEYMLRHLVRPGITGWAQVTGYRGETAELWQMEGRVQRDLWYIQNWSFWLDIRIIFRTAVLTIVHDKNAF